MYRCSDGTLIQKKTIDYRIKKTKEEYSDLVAERLHINPNDIVCERCNQNNRIATRVSRSHIMSVDYCQKTGRSELAYCIMNLEHLCMNDHREIENYSNEIREQWYHFRKDKIMSENEMPDFYQFIKTIENA